MQRCDFERHKFVNASVTISPLLDSPKGELLAQVVSGGIRLVCDQCTPVNRLPYHDEGFQDTIGTLSDFLRSIAQVGHVNVTCPSYVSLLRSDPMLIKQRILPISAKFNFLGSSVYVETSVQFSPPSAGFKELLQAVDSVFLEYWGRKPVF